jgi:NNP family nitrate/nitrite transporter-like MFS transporter
MIPVIFLNDRQGFAKPDPVSQKQALIDGSKEAAAVLGFSGAIGAYGGFFIPKSFGTSIDLTGTPHAALFCFVLFYFSCVAVTWIWYARAKAPMPC